MTSFIGGSSNSSKKVTRNYTTNINDSSNIASQSEAGPAVTLRGDNNSITVTDSGAIGSAFNFSSAALAGSNELSKSALATVSDAQERALNFGASVLSSSLDRSYALASAALTKTTELANPALAQDSNNSSTVQLLIVGLLVIAGFSLYKRAHA